MRLIERVRDTISKFSMLSGGESILTGLSGGPDSVFLLNALHELRGHFDLGLHAIYVDHGFRPNEVPEEIEFCKRLCRRLGIGFTKRKISLSASTVKEHGKQGAAREMRYRELNEEATLIKASKIALGHTMNDAAETLLINILRGSGLTGLRGIRPVRKNIIRPLIEIRKEEILEYLEEKDIGFMTDSSNLKTDYLRNRIRSTILPELRKINPSIEETLYRTSEIIGQEDDYLETNTTKVMMRLFSRKTPARVELFLSPLESTHQILVRRILRRAFAEIKGLKTPSFQNIEDIIGLIRKGSSGDRITIGENLRVIKDYAVLVLTIETPRRISSGYSLSPGEEVPIEESGVVLSATVIENPVSVDGKRSALFDLNKIVLPLSLRARKPGDFFYPSGFGRRKKIQDFFVDEKVPRDMRDTIPLVCSGNDIIWVVGHRTDQRFLPEQTTKDFLLIRALISKK